MGSGKVSHSWDSGELDFNSQGETENKFEGPSCYGVKITLMEFVDFRLLILGDNQTTMKFYRPRIGR